MPRGKRRRWIAFALLAALALVAWLAARTALQPDNVARLLLQRSGQALGLEIIATGDAQLQWRGTPRIVLRDVVARQPGARTPLLHAGRIAVAVPWSTLRARGARLEARRIELDDPVLDLPALQAWLATRPPSQTRIPTLTEGVAIANGRIDNDDWRIEGIDLRMPSLHPQRPVRAHVRGRYLDAPMRIDFDLALTLTRPANAAGGAVVGNIDIARGDWRLPAYIALSGPVLLGGDDLRIDPARLALSATYVSGNTRLPFALGLQGPVHFDEATWSLAPVGVALRGEGVLPDLDAHGAIALGRRLVVRLQGRLPAWPEAWPALPPPLGQSTSALPFELDYLGKPDASDVATLALQRDDARFAGRFRLPEMLAWAAAASVGSPLPPLQGTFSAPRIDVSGAQLEGVEIEMDDTDSVAAPAP